MSGDDHHRGTESTERILHHPLSLLRLSGPGEMEFGFRTRAHFHDMNWTAQLP